MLQTTFYHVSYEVYSCDQVLAHSEFRCSKSRPKSEFLTNHVPSAASHREFDHANRILCLEVGVLVSTLPWSSKCYLSRDLLTSTRNGLREDNSIALKLLGFFNCAYLLAYWHL